MAKKALHIDWARFDGDSFQDMCNDLLVSENPAVVPLKSGPYKDQGRDAFLLKGKIGSISGDIVFQVKYHKPKTGNKNYTALKSDIKGSTSKIGEIAKSEKQKANHLIIMTNVSLNATQVDTLLGLAKGKSIKLHIWEERKIQSLLLKYPFIRFYYIKGPDYPMFVASRYFFGDMLRKRPESIVTHLTRLKGRSSQTRQFRNFLRSQSHILLIYAPPAQGKSRLILEFSRLTPRRTDWIPLFIRPEGKTLNDHLEELNPHSRYILLFEDIHLTYDRIREFTGLLQKTQNNPCIKIVFTARISFSGIIEESLVNAGIQPSAITEMRLPTLPEEDIFKILKDQLPRVIEPYLRDLLPFVKDSPLMAVAAAKLIQQGRQLNEMLQPGRLRNLLFEIPLRDLTKYCKQEGEDPEKHRKILILISALQPISLRDEVLISKMSKFLSIEDYELRAAIGQLLQFGFLKKYGQKVRLIPDTYGTIILENRCLTPQGDSVGLGEKIAIEFFDSSPERILDNMADIGQLSFPRNEIDIIRSAELFVNIKDKVLKADNFQRMDTIKKLGVIAVRRAPEVLDIIEAILANPRAKDDYFTHAHVLDEMTDVIYAIAMNIDYTHHALYLLKRLALDEEVALTHMNQKPDEAIRKIFRYEINKPLEYQKKAFETVTRWKDEDERSFVLAVHSISPIFRSTVSFTHSKGASFTFGNAPLAARTAVKQIRRKALSFLIEALRTGSVEVKFAAIETASNIGRHGFGPSLPKDTKQEITSVIEKEILQLTKVLKELALDSKTGLYLLGRIEKLLWDWWCHKTDKIAMVCLQSIRKIKPTTQYKLFKVLYIERCPVSLDLSVAAKKEGQQERLEYYLKEYREDRLSSSTFHHNLIQEIGKLNSSVYWGNLLKQFAKDAGDHFPTWRYGGFLFSLSELRPRLGFNLYQKRHGTPWEKYGDRILGGIKRSDPSLWISHLDSILKDEEPQSERAICNAIEAATSADNLLDKEIIMLRNFSSHESKEIRATIANNLSIISRSSWFLAEELSESIIKHPCSQKMLDEICSALLHHRPKSLKATPTKIEKAILSLFPKIDNLEEYWCLEFIAKFSEKNPTIILRLAEKMARDKRDVYHLKNVFSKVVPKWKLRKDFFRIINRIKSWLNKSSRLSILAHEILPTFYDPDTLDSLMNYIDKEKPNSIIDTARVVSSFPKNDYFFNAFTELLAMAEPLGEEAFRHVTSILSSSLWLKQGSRTIGKPSQADIDAKNESQKILKANNIPSKVRKVFQEMVKQANDRIQNDMEHDAEFLEK